MNYRSDPAGYTARWFAAYNAIAIDLFGTVVLTVAQDRKVCKLATAALVAEYDEVSFRSI